VKTHVLYVVSSLRREATTRRLALLLAGLAGEEFAPRVLTLEDPRRLIHARLPVEVPLEAVHWRALWDPLAWHRLVRLTRRPIHLVHVWDAPATVAGCLAAWLARAAGLVLGLAEIEPNESWQSQALKRRLARRGAVFVAGNPAVREHYLRSGLPAERVRLIAEGTSPPPAPAERQQVLRELGLPRGSRLIGVAAPLRRRERLKDAIWAADLLKVIRGDVHMVILGEGPQHERLRWFRRQVRIRDKVHFLGPKWQLADLAPHFDVFLATGECGGAGPEVLEVMAAGVPVVAVDEPVVRQLVDPGETGLLAPVGDRAALTRCIQRLLDDRELAQRMGYAAREHAARQFPLYRMVRGYVGLYRELTAGIGNWPRGIGN